MKILVENSRAPLFNYHVYQIQTKTIQALTENTITNPFFVALLIAITFGSVDQLYSDFRYQLTCWRCENLKIMNFDITVGQFLNTLRYTSMGGLVAVVSVILFARLH